MLVVSNMEWAEFEAVFTYLSQAMAVGKEVRLCEAGKNQLPEYCF